VTEPGQKQTDHGWWPYVVPYLAFMGCVEIVRRMPEEWAPLSLGLNAGVPGLLMLYFASKGAYPELRGLRVDLGARALDVGLGVLLAAVWMAPYVWIEAIRPADLEGFDPEQLGTSLVGVTLGLRAVGYGLVTPFFEELFLRSFVMRYSEVYRHGGDFRSVPLAHFARTSFITTVVIFTATHQPWEWWVAIPWVVVTNLWFYYRKDMLAVIVLHAATNLAILGAAMLWSDGVVGGSGERLLLWFFV
jgi:CAAX prenyl protease-like protein